METHFATTTDEAAELEAGASQEQSMFYRSHEDEQENWSDWWQDFNRSGE